MTNINWKKWSIRLGIIGIIIIATIIPNIYENFLNGIVSVGGGSIILGFCLFFLLSFLGLLLALGIIMGIYEIFDISDELGGIIFITIIAITMCLLVWGVQKDYNLTEEINTIKTQQSIGVEYKQDEHYKLENIELESKVQKVQFDIEILESKTEKAGIVHTVKFKQHNLEEFGTYYDDTILLIDKSHYDETIGEDFNSITDNIHTLKLKIPFNIIFRKNSNGRKFCICKEYLYLDLTRYLFLDEKPFSDEEIQKIKEQFINAALEYKAGNEKSFDVFLNMNNVQVVQSGVSEITIKEFESDTYMWNSKTAKKELKNINLKVELLQPVLEDKVAPTTDNSECDTN